MLEMIFVSPHGSKHNSIGDYTHQLRLLDDPCWPIENNQLKYITSICYIFVLTLVGWMGVVCCSFSDNTVPNKCLLVANCSDVT